MVQCAAINCVNNSSSGQKISFFTFPKDPKRRSVWTIKLKREGFIPTQHTRLCHMHFEPECFLKDPRLAQSIGFEPKSLRLKSDAVPTLFDFSTSTTRQKTESTRASRSRHRSGSRAIQKRRKLEIMAEIRADDNHTESVDQTCTDVLLQSQYGLSDETKAPTQVSYHKGQVHMETQTDSCISLIEECVPQNVHLQRFSVSTQTSYNLVERCHAKLQANCDVPRPKTSTFGVQVAPECKSSAVQCNRQHRTRTQQGINLSSNMDVKGVDNLEEADSDDDPSWTPDVAEDHNVEYTADPHKTLKYIVFENSLMELLDVCPKCTRTNLQHQKHHIGSCLSVKTYCLCGFYRSWTSQPLHYSMPWGNLIVAAAVFFSGNSPVKTFKFLDHAGIVGMSMSSYNTIQSCYIVPATLSLWEYKQHLYLDHVRATGQPLKLGGDARCSSPGHTAKYGSYTLMDVQTSKVVDIQLVQCNEVKNSCAMELEGLTRSLQFMQEEKVTISDLVTDRHSQVKKYMRTQQEGISHWFDVWHMAKGVYKKLEAVGKKKCNNIVLQWSRSISNHMYWCAASSQGNGELVRQKWTSILNHITDVHEGHGELFPKCLHDDVTRNWIKSGSKAHGEVEKIVCGRLLLQDIQKLSPAEQTSSLESFHNTICFFAPKSRHYFYDQMKARLCLAALHFNENSSRAPAVAKDGKMQYRVSFPKARKGDPVVKQIKVKQNYDYVQKLMEEVVIRRELYHTYSIAHEARANEMKHPPPDVAASYRKNLALDKDSLIQEHLHRFNT